LALKIHLSNVAILVAIIVASVLTAVISYGASTSAADTVARLNLQSARSNAEIEASDLSNILTNKMDSITSNLQIISATEEVQTQDLNKTRIILNEGQKTTADLTAYYTWLDKNGKLLLASNINETTIQKYRGTDLSHREYFIKAKETLGPYYSRIVESIDGKPRIYFSYPVINRSEGQGRGAAGDKMGTFEGAVVAAIDLQDLGTFLQNQTPAKYKGSVGLMDKGGVILYSSNVTLIGKNVFGPEFQSILRPTGEKFQESFKGFLAESLKGQAGSGNFSVNGTSFTISYKQVSIRQQDYGVLYIVLRQDAPGSDAVLNPVTLVTQQRSLSLFLIAAVGAVAVAAAYLVLSWNKRLEAIVRKKTSELDNANRSLAEANKQLIDANENLRKANEQLAAHDKIQTEFTNIAAHELRTPIQPILAVIEILKKRISGNSSVELTKKQLEIMDRNAKRLQKLSAEILDATRIEAGTLRLDKEVIDINEKVRNVITDIQPLVPVDKDIRILFKPMVTDELNQPIPLLVSIDRLRMFEVISNLIRNAIKFSNVDDTGGNEKTILITTERKENGEGISVGDGSDGVSSGKAPAVVLVSIKDQGMGISAEVMPKLFTRFSADKEKGGTGLGLFIAKNIVEAHGGKMWAENNADGKGATFKFTLPLHLSG
jgi:signal transduction histidine kinase